MKPLFKPFATALLLAGLTLGAGAVPVIFPMQHYVGQTRLNRNLTLTPDHPYLEVGTNVVTGQPITRTPTNGIALIDLTPDGYTVTVDGINGSFHINVTNYNGTLNATDISDRGLTIYSGIVPLPGVSQIVAGNNVTISPTSGNGVVTINSLGGSGGAATNVYQLQINGALLTLQTNLITLVYTIAGVAQTNANMQLWGSVTPAAYSNSVLSTATNAIAASTNTFGIASQLSAFAPTNQFDWNGAATAATNAQQSVINRKANTNAFWGSVRLVHPDGTATNFYGNTAAVRGIAVSNAQQLATSGDTIYIYGDTVVSNSLGKDGVNWNLATVNLSAATNVSLFFISNMTFTVSGSANLYATNANLFSSSPSSTAPSYINIACKSAIVWGPDSGGWEVFDIDSGGTGGAWVINVSELIQSHEENAVASGGFADVTVNCPVILASHDVFNDFETGGYLRVNAKTLGSTFDGSVIDLTQFCTNYITADYAFAPGHFLTLPLLGNIRVPFVESALDGTNRFDGNWISGKIATSGTNIFSGNASGLTNLIHGSTVSGVSGITVALTQNPDGSTNYGLTVSAGGSGTVTSVGLTAPSEFTVSGAPVTGSGSLAFARTAGASANFVGQNATNFANLNATNSLLLGGTVAVDNTNVFQVNTLGGARKSIINTNGDFFQNGSAYFAGPLFVAGVPPLLGTSNLDATKLVGTIAMGNLSTNIVTATNQPFTIGNVLTVVGTNTAGQPVVHDAPLLDATALGANHHVGTGATTNLINQEDFTGYTNSVGYTNYGTGTNIVAVFDGNNHVGTITNGPDVWITPSVAGNSSGSWSWEITTNISLHLPYAVRWLAGSNGVSANVFSITNGEFDLSAYGSTNFPHLKAAIGENQ